MTCIAIALAGPMLSQAKLAYGLTLSVAEIGRLLMESAEEQGDEAYDGSEVVALVANPETGLEAPRASTAPFDLTMNPPAASTLLLASEAARPRRERRRWPPSAPTRQAWLQIYRF
ncbi:hypothetical protein [Singulisphaera sp. PoT]|uniref:hypothetical protein n=1 Tax=Singulisphaera sp. PoT TaxID=3411797 RepID=UPI003BF47DA2